MKTTVNVMGIQAVNILERIADTLKNVLRVGKENRTLQIISEEKESSGVPELEVFTARDPVFAEERLVSEIPEPIWMNAFLVDPKGFADKASSESSRRMHIEYNKMNKHTKAQKRATAGRHTHLTLVPVVQQESTRAQEIRDFRSSPSPPSLTPL